MSFTDQDRRDIRRDSRFLGGLSIGWVAIIVAVVLALGAAIWGITVAVSGVKGQGDAEIEKNSSQNWTQAQADFHKYYEGILADDRKIGVAALALKKNPDDVVLQTNYNGLKNHCEDLVATYNTKAASFLSRDFRDAGLPDRIDTTHPSTDCKEN